MAHKFFGQQGLTPVQQIPMMKKLYPEFSYHIRRSEVNWDGSLTPTDGSRIYRIKLTYKPHDRPRVWVIDPGLQNGHDDKPVLHIYPDGDLCLYQPFKREWRPNDYIAETIVPWTSLWLYYYEVWQAIGEWLGGGEHPVPRKPKRLKA
jgi:hypothetical protein